MKKTYKKRIEKHEWEWLLDSGFIIHEHWTGPFEGNEYTLCRLGETSPLCIRKSERACFNYTRRLAETSKEDSE